MRRARGRPRISAYPSERLDVRVSQPAYDDLCRESLRDHVSLATLIRRMIDRHLATSRPISVGNK